jgi:hypothetical protein
MTIADAEYWNHFVCRGCGASVHRPNRPPDDDFKCPNCSHGAAPEITHH